MDDRLRRNQRFPTRFLCATSRQETPEGFILTIEVTLPERNRNRQVRPNNQGRSSRNNNNRQTRIPRAPPHRGRPTLRPNYPRHPPNPNRSPRRYARLNDRHSRVNSQQQSNRNRTSSRHTRARNDQSRQSAEPTIGSLHDNPSWNQWVNHRSPERTDRNSDEPNEDQHEPLTWDNWRNSRVIWHRGFRKKPKQPKLRTPRPQPVIKAAAVEVETDHPAVAEVETDLQAVEEEDQDPQALLKLKIYHRYLLHLP
jgi:hypothetical protein